MEIFDVFSMNGIEKYPAAGGIFLENVILKVSQTHFSKDFYPKGGGGANAPLGFPKGGCEVLWLDIQATRELCYSGTRCVWSDGLCYAS